jgi:DNA-binding beta-propeller fold protein YncE
MANLYITYAESDAGFAGQLKNMLAPDHTIYEKSPDKINQADRVIFIRSKASLVSPICMDELKWALQKDNRTIYVNWESASINDVLNMIPEANWRMPEEQAKAHISDLIVRLDQIQWVPFEDYRKSSAPEEFSRQFTKLREAIGKENPPHIAFISYRSNIRPLIFAVVRALEAEKYNLWFDRDDIPTGRLWLDVIHEGIEDSRHVVCFITGEWLASWGCNTEFRHAWELNKRIIPVYLEPPPEPEAVFSQAKNGKDWNEPLESVESHIRQVYDGLGLPEIDSRRIDLTHIHAKAAPILAQQNNSLSQAEQQLLDSRLQPFVDELLPPIMAALQPKDDGDHDYLERHTTYYMAARKWNSEGNPTSLLLRDSELNEAIQWLRAGKTRQPAPVGLHHQFIGEAQKRRQRSRQRFIISLASLIFLAVVALFVRDLQARNDLQQQEISAQATLNAETNMRLQTIAQLNRRRLYPSANPILAAQPTLGDQEMWVSDQLNDVLLRLSLIDGAQMGEPIPVGSEPLSAVLDGDTVWVSAGGGSTVTRINTTDSRQTQIFNVGSSPEVPVITQGAAWVIAAPGRTLYRIDKTTKQITSQNLRDPNAFSPITDGTTIWVLLPGNRELLRFTNDVTQPQIIPLEDRPGGALYANNTIYMAVGASIQQLDPLTGQVIARYDGDAPLDPPVFASGAVWTIVRTANTILQLEPQTLKPREQYHIDEAVHKFHVTGNRLFVLGSAVVITFDRTTGNELHRTALPGSNQVTTPVSDGRRLWLTVTQRGRVYVLDETTGEIISQFAPCNLPVTPVFDGANMWFACLGDNHLVALPVMYFFDIDVFLGDNYRHKPVVWGELMWVVQEDAGRVLVYDGGRQVGAYHFGRELLPLTPAENYLYTAYNENGKGTLIRLDPSRPGNDEGVVAAEVSSDILTIQPIESNVWITHASPSALSNPDAANVTVFDQATLELVGEPGQVGMIPVGLTRIGDQVWMTGSNFSSGSIYRFDAKTAVQTGEPFEIPNTTFGAWSPVVIDNQMWFTASSPNVSSIDEVMLEAQTPVNIYPLDLDRLTWGSPIELPDLVGPPRWDGQYLWYPLQGLGLIVPREETPFSTGVLAVEPQTRQIVGQWRPCESLTDFYIAGNFVYIGCLTNNLLFVIDRRDLSAEPRRYEGIGVNPNEPVEHRGVLWFTFQETGSAAAFEYASGELMRVFAVGSSPQAPAKYQDEIWVYNSGDGSLQRIRLPT